MNPAAKLDAGDVFRVKPSFADREFVGMMVKDGGTHVDLDLLISGGVMRATVPKSSIFRIGSVQRIEDDRYSFIKMADTLEAAKHLIERMKIELDQNFVDHHLVIEAQKFLEEVEK